MNPDLPGQTLKSAPVVSIAPQALKNIPTLDGSKHDGPQVDPDFKEDLEALRAEESNTNPDRVYHHEKGIRNQSR